MTSCRPTTSVRYLVNCVINIMEDSFSKNGYLVFGNVNTTNHFVERIRNDILKTIHGGNKYVIQLSDLDKEPICREDDKRETNYLHMETYKGMHVADYFVMIIDDYKEFTYLARKMIRSRFWNPYAKIIIMLIRFTKNDVQNQNYIAKMLDCLFYYNAFNVVIGVPQANNARNSVIYSWKPYEPPNFCGFFNESAQNRLIVQNICERGSLKYNKALFENKLPADMKGCPLQILALERKPFISNDESAPNIEKFLVHTILNKFNFSVKYKSVSGFRGERNEKGEWNGAIEELIMRKGLILLGGIFPDFEVNEDFEYSSTYLADSYIWVVPRAYPSPPWVSLTITFHNLVWYSAIVGFLLCVISWKFLGQLSGDTLYNKTLGHCFLNTWLCLLGFSAYIRPRKQGLRLFFVFLNIYCIIFLTAYQTKLIEVLQNPTYESQIVNIEELVQSDLKFGGSEELHDLFINSSDPMDYVVGTRWIDISNVSEALREMILYRNLSVLCSQLELAYLSAILPELHDSSGAYNYYSFSTATFSVPLEMIALKGFPFMKEISRLLNFHKQIGINALVRRYFDYSNTKKRTKLLLSIQNNKEIFKPLSIQHLRGGFFALAVGILGGVILLFLEISSRYVLF